MIDVLEQSLCLKCKKKLTRRCQDFRETGRHPVGMMWCGSYQPKEGKGKK